MHTTPVWRPTAALGTALLIGLIPGWACSSDDAEPSTLEVAQLHGVPVDCDSLSGSLRAWLRDPDRVRVSMGSDGATSGIPSDFDRIDGKALFIVLNTVAHFDDSTGLACGEQVEFWNDTAAAVTGELPGVGDEFREADPPSTAVTFWTENYPDAVATIDSLRE